MSECCGVGINLRHRKAWQNKKISHQKSLSTDVMLNASHSPNIFNGVGFAVYHVFTEH